MIGLNLRGARRQPLSMSIQSGSTKTIRGKIGGCRGKQKRRQSVQPAKPTSGRDQSGASGRGQWWVDKRGWGFLGFVDGSMGRRRRYSMPMICLVP